MWAETPHTHLGHRCHHIISLSPLDRPHICVQQDEEQGKENKAMQRRLDEVELELGRAQRQRDSHLLHCKSLQHRLATLQDVVLLSHGQHAVGLAPSARRVNLHQR